MSLLDKALEAKVGTRSKKGASFEELELAVAFVRGHVSGAQLMAALGLKVAANVSEAPAKAWAWRVLRGGLNDGRVTISLEDPKEDEFDRRHEAAKAAPVAAKAVAR